MKPSRSRRTKANRPHDRLKPVPASAERRLRLVAAPPDAAGHQGDFTAPDELLMLEDAPGQCPPLNTDSTHARPIIRDPRASARRHQLTTVVGNRPGSDVAADQAVIDLRRRHRAILELRSPD